jgi:hypothetical protein
MILGSPDALVGQSKERGDSFYIVCRLLFEHLLVTYAHIESSDDRHIRYMRYGSPYLSEAGDEGLERLFGFLPHSMEVGLHVVLLVSVGEVRGEPRVELFLGMD